MNATGIRRTYRRLSGRKPPAGAASHPTKLRSKLPRRRRRIPVFPIAGNGYGASLNAAEEPIDSSSSCLCSEIASDYNFTFAGSKPLPPPRTAWKAADAEIRSSSRESRRITRAFYKRPRASLCSTVSKDDANSGAGAGFECYCEPDGKRSKKAKRKTNDSALDQGGVAASEGSEALGGGLDLGSTAKEETIEKAPEVSESSCLDSVSDPNASVAAKSSATDGDRPLGPLNSEAASGGEPRSLDLDSDLACSEQVFSADNGSSDYSSCQEMTVSEMEGELFSSFSDFSEGSSERAAPCATFALFLQLSHQFTKSRARTTSKAKPRSWDESSQDFTVEKFYEEEEEEIYKQFRGREGREAALHDYGAEYITKTEYGHLIAEQRLVMVNWMLEHFRGMELHLETLFLGVSVLDRFLSRGYFKNVRNLHLLGIACITLATRIEENQIFSSIRQRTFRVGDSVYSRSEVVAMEWVVQEVLKFQCFLPTTHNFLWFYLKAARADAEVEDLSIYLAVLSLLDHERLAFRPSTVAACIVILACLATNHDSSSHAVMEMHVRTKTDDLPECLQSLEWLVKHASPPSSQLNNRWF